MIEDVTVLNHDALGNGYHLLVLRSVKIAPAVQPGQFVHLRIPHMQEALLRRPFSVFKADTESLTILYREAGAGTRNMRRLHAGNRLSILGPLGRGFPHPQPGKLPVLVAGGYGMAALYLLAEHAPRPGLVFVGGASERDILCAEEFEQLNWDVRKATEDGSAGAKGLVTDILTNWLTTEAGGHKPEIFACGPNGMLRAISRIAAENNLPAWISMDRHMGCGLGACLACVQKVRQVDSDGRESWQWARICTEGPVFDSRDIAWDDDEK